MTNIPEDELWDLRIIQLDELLYEAMEDGILSRSDLHELADRTRGFAVFTVQTADEDLYDNE